VARDQPRLCACRVGIELEKVEVRVQGLAVSARATAAGRALPSIFNSYRNSVEVLSRLLTTWNCACEHAHLMLCSPRSRVFDHAQGIHRSVS